MARRRVERPEDRPVVPPDLYYGIPRSRFVASTDQAVMGESLSAHREWTAAVHIAGWTIPGIRQAAIHDQNYTHWLRLQRRKRLIDQDPGKQETTK